MVQPWAQTDPVGPFSRAQRGAAPPRVALGNGIEHLSGKGDPNGVRRARKGSHYTERDASPPVVWINTDGAFTWIPLGGGGAGCDVCECWPTVDVDINEFRCTPVPTDCLFLEDDGTHIVQFSQANGWWEATADDLLPTVGWIDRHRAWAFGPDLANLADPLLRYLTRDFFDIPLTGGAPDGRAWTGLTAAAAIANINTNPGAFFRTVVIAGVLRWECVVTDGLVEDVYTLSPEVAPGGSCQAAQLFEVTHDDTNVLFRINGATVASAPWSDATTASLLGVLLARFTRLDRLVQDKVVHLFSDGFAGCQGRVCIVIS